MPEALPSYVFTAEDAARRALRRSRVAAWCFAVVLAAAGVFWVWSSQLMGQAAARAVTSSLLADDYQNATRWAIQLGSLEREYRLNPSAPVRGEFEVASDALAESLRDVQAEDPDRDRATAGVALAQSREYLDDVDRVSATIDGNEAHEAVAAAVARAELSFGRLQDTVVHASLIHQGESDAQLNHLRDIDTLSRRMTPLVGGCALALLIVTYVIIRNQARLLNSGRAQAVHASLHDPLTGLPNRTLFGDRVEQALRAAERERSHVALLLIDLDRFKEINDTFGHAYGDALLVQVGRRLTEVLRAVDTVARLGGDEFAVLLPNVATTADAEAVAAKVTAALETSYAIEGVDLDVEASIGVVHTGDTGGDGEPRRALELLLQQADTAMYVAKTRGQGVAVFRPGGDDAHSPAKLTLLGDLRRALDRGELLLHYQPKIAIDGGVEGRVAGVEALLRWQHPENGLVPPDRFIPVAEHTGLIHPLTRYVIDSAVATAKGWADAGRPIPVAVNLSARNLLDDRLPEHVASCLTRHGLPGGLLHLEVTESAIMTEQARARRLLEELAALGIRISIDDFGAGYTSLSQLRDLPIHELKIDRSFVMTMTTDPANDTIVRSVVDLGHNLGLTIVAEGVETEEALGALAGYGCDLAQGYLFTRPLPQDQFDAWYAARPDGPVSRPGRAGPARSRGGQHARGRP